MNRRRVLAWALWDCGSTGLNAIVATFVFSVYLTSSVGRDLGGDTSPASWLGRALTVSGIAVALFAPLIGVLVGAPRLRRVVLTALTVLAIVFTAAMSFIREDPRYLVPGLILLGLLSAFYPLRRRDGEVMGLLMVSYPITRFLIERLRDDERVFFAGMTVSQNISILIIVESDGAKF